MEEAVRVNAGEVEEEEDEDAKENAIAGILALPDPNPETRLPPRYSMGAARYDVRVRSHGKADLVRRSHEFYTYSINQIQM